MPKLGSQHDLAPLFYAELLARVRALVRRVIPDRSEVLEFGGLSLIPATREVLRDGRSIDLTAREFDLLDDDFSRQRLAWVAHQELEQVWGYQFLGGSSNSIDVHVKSLRDTFEAHGEPRLIHTLRGVGFSLCERTPADSAP